MTSILTIRSFTWTTNQPETPPTSTPPTQAPQNAPYTQQPVEQQYFAQPNAAPPVQYVAQANSLKGIHDWLAFFMIIAGLSALSFTGMLVSAAGNFDSSLWVSVVMLPLLIAAAITSVATIAMEKKIARQIYIAFGVLFLTYTILSSTVHGAQLAEVIGSILSGGL